jgi:hypothetical protein
VPFSVLSVSTSDDYRRLMPPHRHQKHPVTAAMVAITALFSIPIHMLNFHWLNPWGKIFYGLAGEHHR